jgi:hypothetical protein
MDWLPTTYALILGILLRLALPIVATVLIVFLLKRLDEHWKKDSDVREDQVVKPGNVGCWDINNCPEENRAACKAYQNPQTPCWQVFRMDNGRLQERCIGCEVFRHAPVPITA